MEKYEIKNQIILNEIYNECVKCKLSQECPEDECPLWRIEQVVLANSIKTRISINDLDPEELKELREAIKNNQGYCICALDKTPDTKCPCKEFREEIPFGECHCGLYKKELILEDENK